MQKKKNIGTNIRRLRLEKGMTLKELAEKTELSMSYLSMAERGLCSIYLSAIQRIAEALEVSQSDLNVASLDIRNGLVRSYERPSIKLEGSTMIYNYLIDEEDISRFYNAIRVTILPNQSMTNMVPYSHGGEEFIYVLQGVLTLRLDNHSYSLSEGDSAHFHSYLQHEWLNFTDQIVVILCVHSDPNARYFEQSKA